MTRVMVTGGAGFVGQAVCPALLQAGFEVSVAARNPRAAEKFRGIEIRPIPNIGAGTDWSAALRGVDAVVHMAARVHVMEETAGDPLSEFRRVNVEGTLRLAEDAALAGVSRFVYLSSVKVMGEATAPGQPYVEDQEPRTRDPYGVSKLEAEEALKAVAAETAMEAVILRPTLAYGPFVKGNFLSLLERCEQKPTLPLAAVRNARSLIYAGNLADAVIRCLTHPAAAGEIFLVRDGEDLSTPDMIHRTSAALHAHARLWPLPPPLLRLAGMLTGRSGQVTRLLDSLTVDDGKIRRLLDWQPPYSVDQGLQATADWFKTRHVR